MNKHSSANYIDSTLQQTDVFHLDTSDAGEIGINSIMKNYVPIVAVNSQLMFPHSSSILIRNICRSISRLVSSIYRRNIYSKIRIGIHYRCAGIFVRCVDLYHVFTIRTKKWSFSSKINHEPDG